MRQAHIVPNKKGLPIVFFCSDIGMKQTFFQVHVYVFLAWSAIEVYRKSRSPPPANWMKTCEVWPGWWQKVKYRLSEPPI